MQGSLSVNQQPLLVILRRNSARPRYRAAAVEAPTLVQFVVLSILLHVLLIVLFGNPPGIARRNEGWWGPLEVALAPPLPTPGIRLAPGLETNSPSSLPSGGATNTPAKSSSRAMQPPAGAPAPVETLPRLNPSAPEEVDKTIAPPVPSPEPVERIAPPERSREIAPPLQLPVPTVPLLPSAPIEPIAPPESSRDIAPPPELPPPTVPVLPAAPIERIAPPEPSRDIAPPPELPLPSVPVLPAAPIERAVVPGSEPQLAPPVEVPPRALPVSPTAPLERAAPPALERELAPAVELPGRQSPAAPAAPLERLAPPAPIEPKFAPPVELAPREEPMPPTAPLEPQTPQKFEREVAPPVELPAAPAERRAARVTPSAPPAVPAERQSAQRFGEPEANEEIFKPRRDVAPTPPEAPHIDLDAARKKAAREVVSEGSWSGGVFTVPPPPPVERKSKDTTGMEKAIKPDCRNAYANMGLLAVPVLVVSAIAADGSCRW